MYCSCNACPCCCCMEVRFNGMYTSADLPSQLLTLSLKGYQSLLSHPIRILLSTFAAEHSKNCKKIANAFKNRHPDQTLEHGTLKNTLQQCGAVCVRLGTLCKSLQMSRNPSDCKCLAALPSLLLRGWWS